VIKDIRGSKLVDSVRAVGACHSLIAATVKRRPQAELQSMPAEDPRLIGLTARQRDVLALIAEALTNRQIGERMGLAEKTVKNYVSEIPSETGVTAPYPGADRRTRFARTVSRWPHSLGLSALFGRRPAQEY
jgi:two-component system response regulator DevR